MKTEKIISAIDKTEQRVESCRVKLLQIENEGRALTERLAAAIDRDVCDLDRLGKRMARLEATRRGLVAAKADAEQRLPGLISELAEAKNLENGSRAKP